MWRRGSRHERGGGGVGTGGAGDAAHVGAGKASLLVPQPVTANAQTGLGLMAPLVNEVEMEPVLLQATANGKTLFAQDDPRHGAESA